MTNTFLERVCNSIDLEAGADPHTAWNKLRSCSDISSAEKKKVNSCSAEALTIYPVSWHTPQALCHDPDVSDRKRWDFYSHCSCSGSTRYYGKGPVFESFFPRAFNGRPPCCFTEATIHIGSDQSVEIFDGAERVLYVKRCTLPITFSHNDRRSYEETLMWILIQNVWWLAHENCKKVIISYNEPTDLIKTSYPTQLALPFLSKENRISLITLIQKLAQIYSHVQFYIEHELIRPEA